MDDSTAAIRFRIGGALRFLSHAETARLWQRACTRAALPVRYSQGFNPHPRMSLPLPRPVGVAADEELLVVKLCDERQGTPVADRAEREAALKAGPGRAGAGRDRGAGGGSGGTGLVPAAIRRVRSTPARGGRTGPGGKTEECR